MNRKKERKNIFNRAKDFLKEQKWIPECWSVWAKLKMFQMIRGKPFFCLFCGWILTLNYRKMVYYDSEGLKLSIKSHIKTRLLLQLCTVFLTLHITTIIKAQRVLIIKAGM